MKSSILLTKSPTIYNNDPATLDIGLLDYTVSPEVMQQQADDERVVIDSVLKGEAKVYFVATLQAVVENIQNAIREKAVERQTTLHWFEIEREFNLELGNHDLCLTSAAFVENTLSMGDYIERFICPLGIGTRRMTDTRLQDISDSVLYNWQTNRGLFILWLYDRFQAVFEKAGYEVTNTYTIERAPKTRFVAQIDGRFSISW